MKRALGVLLTVVCAAFVALPVAALDTDPTPPELPSSPLLITGYQALGSQLLLVQIYNNSSQLVNLADFGLAYAFNDGVLIQMSPENLNLSGQIEPGRHGLIAEQGSLLEPLVGEFAATTNIDPTQKITQLQLT